jgi:small subunit ribosomal protein S17
MNESHRKERVGVVESNKMDKTIVVKATNLKRHPFYGKVIKQSRKFYVHDEKNTAQIGDNVRIVETRPLSRLKRWVLKEVLEQGQKV